MSTEPFPTDGASALLRKIATAIHGLYSGGGLSQGGLRELPADNANGAILSEGRPAGTDGIRFYLPAGASLEYFFTSTGATLSSPPSMTVEHAVAGQLDEPLSGDDAIAIVASVGDIRWRWIKR